MEGSLPSDLTGAYLRNGPNPKFTPLGSYTYPLEGDAMVHGLWIEGGKARYANRWVRTKGMAAEERAGRLPLRRTHDPGIRRYGSARTGS